MSGRPKLYQSKQPSGGKETAARLFYTQEAADFYDALMKQNLMKGSKVAESFHAYHEKHENKPPPPPAAETKKSSSKESQTDDKEFNKARDRPIWKSRLWGIVVGVAKACFVVVVVPVVILLAPVPGLNERLDHLLGAFMGGGGRRRPSDAEDLLLNFGHSDTRLKSDEEHRKYITLNQAPTGILGIVGCAVTGDLWAVSKLPTSILRAVFRIVIGAVTGEFPKARPRKMYWLEPRHYEDSKEVYDFTYWYYRDDGVHICRGGTCDPLNQRDNTARIKWKFRRRLLGWFTVLRSLVKTPTSYFGVGFGLLVLYCDRNINKDKLRECMEGSKWTEYAKNRCEERNAIAKTFAIHPGHMNPIFKPK